VLLGHGENSIFEIREELASHFPDLRISSVIADVRDRRRLDCVFDRFAPDAVYHAAAHKHVPLMEANVIEAVTNNVIGTRNVVGAAAAAGTENVVLISTDKAVRPVSVMGATKRIAEQIVQASARRHGRPFVAVRFGNVLGSRGSVVPTFLRQIEAGGPITVTDPEMRRYFMTIPEAVQLVLQAGALGVGGEVFVLDMGEPVKIVDLATDLIRLSGLRVNDDIEIRFTGARPGEKLFEEIFFGGENIVPTQHPKVLRARDDHPTTDSLEGITTLISATEAGASDLELRRLIAAIVPDFRVATTEQLVPVDELRGLVDADGEIEIGPRAVPRSAGDRPSGELPGALSA
jgi:FlaA1/EpsC-like NDP-sugar epimerase